MPDRAGDVQLQILKIDIAPAKCKQFADPKSSCGIEKSQSTLPNEQLAEEELKFEEFEDTLRKEVLLTIGAR